MFILYNLLLTLAAPFWVPWMVWRAHKRGEKPNWRERQGDYRESIPKKGDRPRLWVHTVSVGEFVAAQPLLRELRRELPNHEIVLSVTTSSGHQTAREASEKLYDHLVYLPIDVARFTLSAMQRVRPDALIVLETELWMNLFWAARTFDAKTFVVNARLSDRSFPRARKLGFFYRPLLAMVDRVLAQSETDAGRFRELGAKSVEAAGNIKFDQAMEGLDDATDWRKELKIGNEKPVVVLGSLRAEEFEEFSEMAVKTTGKQWIVAPRHLERVEELEDHLQTAVSYQLGLDGQWSWDRRSYIALEEEGGLSSPDLIILDTYGELARVYAIADVAVVGGGFKKLGGQNPIQPLAHGKPVLFGPYMANFRDVAALAERAGAAKVACDTRHLGVLIDEILADNALRSRMGEAARALVRENQGAAGRMAKAIASSL